MVLKQVAGQDKKTSKKGKEVCNRTYKWPHIEQSKFVWKWKSLPTNFAQSIVPLNDPIDFSLI